MKRNNNIKHYREKLNLTQFELGKRVNVDSTQISRIERTGKCSLIMAKILADTLNTSIENLFFKNKNED